ncbi:signal transduction histidine kinase [Lipingzhangella halophila]|uniref:histidine kinase n=1 Tax=Lipingzhangella halophila TaxID=1783352 RepID=A0A7W7RKS9_9ACTN|nr:nitrate- and nitrite sensing domain-containing protein [Lipingzhangella halophila]MBB4933814.1 signal transduction histidine kinase [Lipingzhangella halophila]
MQEAKQRRVRSIESRVRRGVLVPIAALVAVWLAVSGYLAYGAFTQYSVANNNDELLTPTAIALTAVMDERSATAAYVERPGESREALEAARAEADERMAAVLDRFEGGLSSTPHEVHDQLHALDREFGKINDVRDEVDQGELSRSEILTYYNELSAVGADVFHEQAHANSTQEAVGPGMSATSTFRAIDILARADAQLARSFASGELSMADQAEFTRLAGSYRAILHSLHDGMGPEPERALGDLRASSDWSTLTDLEETIAERTVTSDIDPETGDREEDLSLPVSEDEWRTAYTPVKEALTELGGEQAEWYTQVQQQQANWAIVLAAGGSLGIAALGAGVFVFAIRSARLTVGRLHRLRDETQELTDRGLPETLEKVRANPGDSVCTEALRVSGGDENDEIGQVARSFNSAHHTAINAAVRQAEMRQGINRVFLNIAHRSQTLVHRQLKLLDKMERDQEDPNQLTELFKLDHLATRSRRNAENLLILGGETPGRTWHRPMPLIDVLRGAISESGDYTRVQREQIAQVSLTGPAVADVIHLVAELVDNATTFSPPHTQVRLSSEQVANGVAIEIEDRGLGMQDTEFETANELLAEPPEFDVMRLNERTRLGLFVVSRLAYRHAIQVNLRSSPYGGTQAIVLLPPDIVVTDAPSRSHSSNATEVSEVSEAGDPLALPDGTTPEPDVLANANGQSAGRHSTQNSAGGEYTASGLPKRERSGTAPHASSNGAASEHVPSPSPAPEPVPETETPSVARPALPKRTPQTNLAPQLYDTPPGPSDTPTETPSEVTDRERSDRLRRDMTAFQHGTQRGRLDARHRTTDTEKDS